MKYILFLCLVVSIQCSSAQKQDGEAESGVLDLFIEKAQSEEGQKAIASAKEKLEDKENQEKLKSSLSSKKKK